MEVNSQQVPQNQGYWFVLREDQSNVIFSTSNITIQNPAAAVQEAKFVVDANDDRYIQVNATPVAIQEEVVENCEPVATKCKKVEFWDRNKVKLLLKLCLENKIQNITKDRAMCNGIASYVGTTPDECIRTYKNLKRTYLRLLSKKKMGKDIKWVHFNLCDEVFKDCKSLQASAMQIWDDGKVRKLLSLYIANLNRFRTEECLQKDIWKDMAAQVGMSQGSCYHKFKNLKRTYFINLQRRNERGKQVKWPYHQYFERIFLNYKPQGPRWDREKIKSLIHAYSQVDYKFKNPKFLKRELWKEIAAVVGESAHNCDRKFRNLKSTYIKLKHGIDAGRTTTKWRYYRDMDLIFNSPVYYLRDETGALQAVYRSQEDDYIEQLLNFYIENLDKFKDPLIRKRPLWKIIGSKIKLSPEECDKKFRNLKQTYMRLVEKKRETGSCNKWPYFSYLETIFGASSDCNVNTKESISYLDIKRLVKDVQGRQESDKQFSKLVQVMEESINVQRERNRILSALLERR